MKKWVIVLIIFLISVPLVFAAPPKVKLTVTPISGDSPLVVTYDENSGDETTIKEDLRGAITSVIQRYADMRPLGTGTNGAICK
jgi:hypothetical protein